MITNDNYEKIIPLLIITTIITSIVLIGAIINLVNVLSTYKISTEQIETPEPIKEQAQKQHEENITLIEHQNPKPLAINQDQNQPTPKTPIEQQKPLTMNKQITKPIIIQKEETPMLKIIKIIKQTKQEYNEQTKKYQPHIYHEVHYTYKEKNRILLLINPAQMELDKNNQPMFLQKLKQNLQRENQEEEQKQPPETNETINTFNGVKI